MDEPVFQSFPPSIRSSENKVSSHLAKKLSLIVTRASLPEILPYPLQLDIVKHLVILSPVRPVLASVLGSSIFEQSGDGGEATGEAKATIKRLRELDSETESRS
ncbi:hypothetical protein ACLB2K_073618 [Fragaria x ananassa]